MKRAVAIVVALAAGAFAASAQAATQRLTVVQWGTHIPAAQLKRAEKAVEWQSQTLSAEWNTPTVTFGRGGWLVLLVPSSWVRWAGQDSSADDGYHEYGTQPYAVVGVDSFSWEQGEKAYPDWEYIFSHEAMEMMADPRTGGVEVCDPLESEGPRAHGGALVAPFIAPS